MPTKRRPGRGVNATGRSKGDGQYLPIPYSMARHDAFRSMSGAALKVWIELRTRFNGYNNGRVSLSLGEAAELLGMGKTTAQRAMKELIEKGFVKLRTPGQWWGRKATEYVLTDVKVGESLPTRDWQNWRPPAGKKQNAVPTRNSSGPTVPSGAQTPDAAYHGETRHVGEAARDGAV